MRRPMLALRWESLQLARVASPHLLAEADRADRGLLCSIRFQPVQGCRLNRLLLDEVQR